MMKRILVFLTAACLLFAAVSCKSGMAKKDGGFFCSKNGVFYRPCSPALFARYQGDEFATGDDGTVFYEAPGLIPAEYLTCDLDGDAALYHADGITPPERGDFTGSTVLLTRNGKTLRIYEQKSVCESLFSALENGESPQETPDVFCVCRIYLDSGRYSALYYGLKLTVDQKGNQYLTDRGEGKTVLLPAGIFDSSLFTED